MPVKPKPFPASETDLSPALNLSGGDPALCWRSWTKGAAMNYFMLNLGRILFPHLPRDLCRHRLDVFFLTVFVSAVVAGITALVIAGLAKWGRH
jgi:hypothetical protein